MSRVNARITIRLTRPALPAIVLSFLMLPFMAACGASELGIESELAPPVGNDTEVERLADAELAGEDAQTHSEPADGAGAAGVGAGSEGSASEGENEDGGADAAGAGAPDSDEAPPALDEEAAAGDLDLPPSPPELSEFVSMAADTDAMPDAEALGITLLPSDPADAPDEEPSTLYRDITWLGIEAATEELAEGALWAVWTTGFLGYKNAPHVLGLYERQTEGWQRLAQLALTDEALPASERAAEPGAPPQPFPPMVDERSVSQVKEAPDGWVWLSVSGGWGANGGAFQLVGFDGQALSSLMALMEVFPGGTQVGSLNADDIAEIVEDRTDGYVLCRACGVREAGLRIHVFDLASGAFAPADLVSAPTSWDPNLRERADRSLELAEAGLWKEAARLMDEVDRAVPATDTNEAHAWTRETIRMNAEARRALAQPNEPSPGPGSVKPANTGNELSGAAGEGNGSGDGAEADGAASDDSSDETAGMAPEPDQPAPSIQLMHRMFYGDYAAVLEQMRQSQAAAHFGAAPPLLDAHMSNEQLDRIIEETEPILVADPQLVGAWLLRGWALSLRYPGEDEGPMALVRASELAPDDAFVAAMAAEASR